MTVHFELSKDDMKNIYPDAFYLMPSSRKSKNADFLFAFLITIIALDLIADFPFVMSLMIAMVLGILIYFFASRWILKFVTLFMIWKYKNSFPRRYQLDLHDNYFIYTDLDNETNHGKIAWNSIEEVKETDNYLYIYVGAINKVLILNKNISLSSPTSKKLYIETVKEKIQQL